MTNISRESHFERWCVAFKTRKKGGPSLIDILAQDDCRRVLVDNSQMRNNNCSECHSSVLMICRYLGIILHVRGRGRCLTRACKPNGCMTFKGAYQDLKGAPLNATRQICAHFHPDSEKKKDIEEFQSSSRTPPRSRGRGQG